MENMCQSENRCISTTKDTTLSWSWHWSTLTISSYWSTSGVLGLAKVHNYGMNAILDTTSSLIALVGQIQTIWCITIFTNRLSRSRNVVEDAFGIIASRFGCLLITFKKKPTTVETIVLACVRLHNIMRIRYPQDQNGLIDNQDNNHNAIPGAWRQRG